MRIEVESVELSNVGGVRGSNQTAVRVYNERLVLSLVRRHGSLAKVDIARSTGLSAQTISVIMRALETDGLLLRGEPIRGKVGQPSVPMSLNPEGAYSLGLKIGRRSADIILLEGQSQPLREWESTLALQASFRGALHRAGCGAMSANPDSCPMIGLL